LGKKYEIGVEAVSKSREEYQSEAYKAAGLPAAPAVMVDDEVVGQGPEISAEKLEIAIRRHLGLPSLEAQT